MFIVKLIKTLQAELFRIIIYQFLMIMGFAFIMVWLKGLHKSLSIWMGSMAYWLPTLLFVWGASLYAGSQAIYRFLVAFFVGEAVKLLLSGLLFLLAVKYIHVNVLFALIGLIVAIFAFWVASFACLYQTGVRS